MQRRLLPRSRAARARHGARPRSEGEVSECLRSPGAPNVARMSGISTNYEFPTGQSTGSALAGYASVPEGVRGRTPFADGAPRTRLGAPEPDTKLAAVPDRPNPYDAGMYVAANGCASSF